MGRFLTSPAVKEQCPQKGMYRLLINELFLDDDGSIYLVWRNFYTDDFTWIVSGDWDTRCSHIHDECCKFHQLAKVKLTEKELRKMRYLHAKHDKVICEDIPPKFLEVIDVSGNFANNLFYRMLRDADCPKTPKFIQYLYRAGVALNFKWFLPRKKKIDITKIYEEEWNRG